MCEEPPSTACNMMNKLRTHKFQFSCIDLAERLILITKAHELGAIGCDQGPNYEPHATHVIVEKLKISEKILASMASGKWILHKDFIYDSHRVGYWLQERYYEIRCKRPYNEDAYSSDENLHSSDENCINGYDSEREENNAPRRCRQMVLVKGHPMFFGWDVGLLIQNEMERDSLQRILEAGGATVSVLNLPLADVCHLWKSSLKCVFVDERSEEHKPLESVGVPCITQSYIHQYLFKDPPPPMEDFCVGYSRDGNLNSEVHCVSENKQESSNCATTIVRRDALNSRRNINTFHKGYLSTSGTGGALGPVNKVPLPEETQCNAKGPCHGGMMKHHRPPLRSAYDCHGNILQPSGMNPDMDNISQTVCSAVCALRNNITENDPSVQTNAENVSIPIKFNGALSVRRTSGDFLVGNFPCFLQESNCCRINENAIRVTHSSLNSPKSDSVSPQTIRFGQPSVKRKLNVQSPVNSERNIKNLHEWDYSDKVANVHLHPKKSRWSDNKKYLPISPKVSEKDKSEVRVCHSATPKLKKSLSEWQDAVRDDSATSSANLGVNSDIVGQQTERSNSNDLCITTESFVKIKTTYNSKGVMEENAGNPVRNFIISAKEPETYSENLPPSVINSMTGISSLCTADKTLASAKRKQSEGSPEHVKKLRSPPSTPEQKIDTADKTRASAKRKQPQGSPEHVKKLQSPPLTPRQKINFLTLYKRRFGSPQHNKISNYFTTIPVEHSDVSNGTDCVEKCRNHSTSYPEKNVTNSKYLNKKTEEDIVIISDEIGNSNRNAALCKTCNSPSVLKHKCSHTRSKRGVSVSDAEIIKDRSILSGVKRRCSFREEGKIANEVNIDLSESNDSVDEREKTLHPDPRMKSSIIVISSDDDDDGDNDNESVITISDESDIDGDIEGCKKQMEIVTSTEVSNIVFSDSCGNVRSSKEREITSCTGIYDLDRYDSQGVQLMENTKSTFPEEGCTFMYSHSWTRNVFGIKSSAHENNMHFSHRRKASLDVDDAQSAFVSNSIVELGTIDSSGQESVASRCATEPAIVASPISNTAIVSSLPGELEIVNNLYSEPGINSRTSNPTIVSVLANEPKIVGSPDSKPGFINSSCRKPVIINKPLEESVIVGALNKEPELELSNNHELDERTVLNCGEISDSEYAGSVRLSETNQKTTVRKGEARELVKTAEQLIASHQNVMYKHHDSAATCMGLKWISDCCLDPYSCTQRHKNTLYKPFEVCDARTQIMEALMYARQWSDAFDFCCSITSERNYPNVSAVLRILDFILNTHNVDLIGHAVIAFKKIVDLHPPCAPHMLKYYTLVLTGTLGKDTPQLSANGIVQDVIFRLKEMVSSTDLQSGHEDVPCHANQNTLINMDDDDSILNEEPLDFAADERAEADKNYMTLSHEEKFNRLFLVLEIIMELFEVDLSVFLVKRSFDLRKALNHRLYKPLIVSVLWRSSTMQGIGHLNGICKCIIDLYVKCFNLKIHFKKRNVIARLLNLVAEAVRASECNDESMYPYFGERCETLAREVSLYISGINPEDLVQALSDMMPSFLALYVTNFLITKTVGNETTPALNTILDLVPKCCSPHNVYEVEAKKVNPELSATENCKVVGKSKNINKRDEKGETILHRVCRKNEVGKLKVLLKYPDINVNAMDNFGWTALHEAVQSGAVDCVRELLGYRPPPGLSRTDMRAQSEDGTTPLIDAAQNNQLESCKLLLEYGGSSLLNDKNHEGKNALDATTLPEIKELLESVRKEDEVIEVDGRRHYSSLVPLLLPIMLRSYVNTYQTVHIVNNLRSCMKGNGNKTVPAERKGKKTLKFDYTRSLQDYKSLRKLKGIIRNESKKVPDNEMIKKFLFLLQ